MIGQSVFAWIQALRRTGKQNMFVHPYSFGITTRQKSGPRRSANRGGHHETGKLPALFGDTINIWCLDFRGAKTTEISLTLVIGEDKHEVRGRDLGVNCSQKGKLKEKAKSFGFHPKIMIMVR